MRKLLTASVLAVIGLAASGGKAQAWQWNHYGPWAQTAAFPSANPPGWYTNTYSYAWQYPWYAYYNYSHGPYANWMAGGGYAYYGGLPQHAVSYAPWANPGGAPADALPPGAVPAPAAVPVPVPDKLPDAAPAKVSIRLPADARLLFNGIAATGAGSDRTFHTLPLQHGQEYRYELTAEVLRDGKAERVTERVIVRAGETATVTLMPSAIVTAGK